MNVCISSQGVWRGVSHSSVATAVTGTMHCIIYTPTQATPYVVFNVYMFPPLYLVIGKGIDEELK